MTTGRPVHAAVYLCVATVLLALFLRTWVVMGLIEPVTVAGSSMAPALRGSFVEVNCQTCQTAFPVGSESLGRTRNAACPHCGELRVPLRDSVARGGDRLWIDRTAFHWRTPRRWEVVVLRSPEDSSKLCVKRIAALPGETVQLAGGDLLVNGECVTKPLADQLEMRQILHRADGPRRSWTTEHSTAWQWSEGVWRHLEEEGDETHWLRYSHFNQRAVTDDVPFNAGLSRPLNLVHDFMLSASIRIEGQGTLACQLQDGLRLYRVTICPSAGTVSLLESGKELMAKAISTRNRQRLNRDAVRLVLSNFDRQLLLAFDDQVELSYQLSGEASPRGTAQPFALGALGLRVELAELAVSRDIYHSHAAAGTRTSEFEAPIQLGHEEYYVLGDNPPVSIDSRFWGPVSGKLLLGKPLGGR